MMTIARVTSHPFYTVLLVEESTFDDVKERLNQQGILGKHLMEDEDGIDIIVLGSTALKGEKTGF